MNSSIKHFQFVYELAELGKMHGLIVYEHEYRYMGFGSWTIIIGKGTHRTKFRWDGKESDLDIRMSAFQNSNSMPDWKPVFPHVGGTKKTEAEVFAFVMQVLETQSLLSKTAEL